MIKLRRYSKGEVIIRENDLGELAFIIEKGKVEVTKEIDGKEVNLAFLTEADTFGEMSIINDNPRSATVTAIEDTTVQELHRDNFLKSLKSDPDFAPALLRSIFERLRVANATILQLKSLQGHADPETSETSHYMTSAGEITVSLEGLTEQAEYSLYESPLKIKSFPFRIGRQSEDPLIYNDLSIYDTPPLQVSRHHVSIVQEGDKIGVLDRGSHLGASVDKRRIGGKKDLPGPVFFEEDTGMLVLGTKDSPFQFKVNINRG